MKNRKLFGFLCLTVFLVLYTAPVNLNSVRAAAPLTKIFVYDPLWEGEVSTANLGEEVTIEIRIANVTELIGWQFFLQWNSSMLDLVGVAEGPFLNHSGSYLSDFGPVRKPGDTKWPYSDTMYTADSLINPTREMAATGSGVLATLTFQVKAKGISVLHLLGQGDTILVQWYPPQQPGLIKEIPYEAKDGYFILPGPKVFVDPRENFRPDLKIGEGSFNVNISIADVENLYNSSLLLKWDPKVLYGSAAVAGPFLKDAAPPGGFNFAYKFDNTIGSLSANYTLTGAPLSGVNGNGTLVTVTFLVLAKGETDLKLSDTKLFKSDNTPILHVRKSGLFSNVNHDVAITNVDVAPTTVRVGESVNITVTAQNKGEVKESFHVTVYYDSNTIGSSFVSDLTPNNSTTLKISWDTSKVAPGTYTITANASRVPGEVNLANNGLAAASKVTVTGGQFDIMMLLMIGGVAVAASGGTAGFFLYRRRSKKQ